jgi:hypothetical protein
MYANSGSSGTLNFSLLPVDGVQDLVNTDVDALSDIIRQYSQIADEAQQSARFLRDKSSDVPWQSQAATAFYKTVGKVPSDLDTVHDDYSTVSGALATYLGVVEDVQSPVVSILTQLQEKHDALTTAQGTLSSDQSTLNGLKSTQRNPPATQTAAELSTANTAISHAGSNVSTASSAVSSIQGEITELQTTGRHLVEEYTTARSKAVSTIHGAAHNAPHESFWDHVLGDVENVVKQGLIISATMLFGPMVGKYVGEFAYDVVKGVVGVVKNAADLPGAIVNVVEHPGSLHAWERLGTDTVAAATIVLLVTGVGEGLLATDVTVEAADGTIVTVDAADTATSTTVDDIASQQGTVVRALHTVNEVGQKDVVQNALKYGGYATQVEGEADDIRDGNWKGALEDGALDVAGDGAANFADKGNFLPGGRGKVGNFDGIDTMSGAEGAHDQLATAQKFNQLSDDSSGNNYDAYTRNQRVGATSDNSLSVAEKKQLAEAAGVSPGALNRSTVSHLNTKNIVYNAQNKVTSTAVRSGLISNAADGTVDGTKDAVKGLVKHYTGIEGAGS